MIYTKLIRPLAFRLDPETAHHLAIAAGARLGWAAGAMRATTCVDDIRLKVDVDGLRFPTPIGLAAGFDKSGAAISALAGLGFGAIEIGSVSVDPSQGNPKPRLWRLPDDRGIVVHYGLPNDGVAAIAERRAPACRCRSGSISWSPIADQAQHHSRRIRSSANTPPPPARWRRTRIT